MSEDTPEYEPTPKEPSTYPEYLGDGVYAEFDGWYITLDLRAQDNYTRIGLEPQVMRALIEYAKRTQGIEI